MRRLLCISIGRVTTAFRREKLPCDHRLPDSAIFVVPASQNRRLVRRFSEMDTNYGFFSPVTEVRLGRRFYNGGGTAAPHSTRPQANRDMPVSSFVVALVFVGVALAAYADRPPHLASSHRDFGAKPVASSNALSFGFPSQ